MSGDYIHYTWCFEELKGMYTSCNRRVTGVRISTSTSETTCPLCKAGNLYLDEVARSMEEALIKGMINARLSG